MAYKKIQTVYADKGYTGFTNRNSLISNKIKDGIMHKGNINTKLAELEIERNKSISRF